MDEKTRQKLWRMTEKWLTGSKLLERRAKNYKGAEYSLFLQGRADELCICAADLRVLLRKEEDMDLKTLREEILILLDTVNDASAGYKQQAEMVFDETSIGLVKAAKYEGMSEFAEHVASLLREILDDTAVGDEETPEGSSGDSMAQGSSPSSEARSQSRGEMLLGERMVNVADLMNRFARVVTKTGEPHTAVEAAVYSHCEQIVLEALRQHAIVEVQD